MATLLLTLLLACYTEVIDDTGVPSVCPTARDLPVVAACVVPAGADPSTLSAGEPMALDLADLVVVDQGVGAPPSGCVDLPAWLGATAAPSLEGSGTTWALVEDGTGQRLEVALTLPGTGSAWDLADGLSLAWAYDGFEPFDGRNGAVQLTVRAADGTLEGWVGTGAGAGTLATPAELVLAHADEDCRTEQECGTRVDYVVQATADGRSESLRAGDQASLGRWRVAMGQDYAIEDLHCSETPGVGGAFGMVQPLGAD